MNKKNNNNNKHIKNDITSYVNSQLKSKFKTDERNDIDKQEINKNEEKTLSKITLKQRWSRQKVDLQYKTESISWKNILSRAISGLVFSSNSVVYGSSSSLFLYQTNNFQKIVNGFCDFFTPKSLRDFLWKCLWVIPFFISFLIAFIVIYAIYSTLYAVGFELAATFLFIGISFIGFIALLLNKKKRTNNFFSKTFIKEKKFNYFWIIGFSVIVLLIFGISFAARYAWGQEFPSSHLNFQQFATLTNNDGIVSSIIANNSIQTGYAIQILLSSFLAGFTSFIPGLSGSFMLAVIGTNDFINLAVRFAIGSYNSGLTTMIDFSWAWSTIIISFIGIALGFVSSAFAVRYLMNNFDNVFKLIALSLSFILFIALLVSLKDIDYKAIGNNNHLLIASVVILIMTITIGSGVVGYINRFEIKTMWGNFINK